MNKNKDNKYNNLIESAIQNMNNSLHDESISEFLKIIKNYPDDIKAYNYLAMIYRKKNDIDLAIDILKQALDKSPNNIDLLNNIGGFYIDKGNKNEAFLFFKKILDIDEYNAEAFRALSVNNTIDLNDDLALKFIDKYETYRSLLNNNRLEKDKTEDLSNIAFALGFLFDKSKKYDEAFEYYLEANKLHRSLYKYEINIEKKLFKQIIDFFNHDYFKNIKKDYRSDKSPIFIIGMPRSGTTLVEQIISSHSKVTGCGEVEYIRELAGRALEYLPNKSLNELRNLTNNQKQDLANLYLNRIGCDNSQLNRTTDKQTLNFIYVGFIKTIFPNAKIINVKRNPIDTCLSIFFLKFLGHHPYAYNLSELGQYYSFYQDMINNWEKNLGNELFTINYEDLVTELEPNVRKILAYCDLEFENDCLEFYKNNRSVSTASSLQVKQKIYNSSINRGRNYLEKIVELKNHIS